MKILIADRCSISRLGIRSIVSHVKYSAIAEASNVEELLIRLNDGYDLLTLDPAIAGCSTRELIDDIFSVDPRVKLIILTSLDARHHGLEAFRAGIVGFLSKSCSVSEIAEAVNSATGSTPFITDKMAADLFWFLNTEQQLSNHKHLTNRELDIFALLFYGQTVSKIAKILNLSPKTISTHKSRIMFKLRVDNISLMYQYAINQSLAEELLVRSTQFSVGFTADGVCV